MNGDLNSGEDGDVKSNEGPAQAMAERNEQEEANQTQNTQTTAAAQNPLSADQKMAFQILMYKYKNADVAKAQFEGITDFKKFVEMEKPGYLESKRKDEIDHLKNLDDGFRNLSQRIVAIYFNGNYRQDYTTRERAISAIVGYFSPALQSSVETRFNERVVIARKDSILGKYAGKIQKGEAEVKDAQESIRKHNADVKKLEVMLKDDKFKLYNTASGISNTRKIIDGMETEQNKYQKDGKKEEADTVAFKQLELEEKLQEMEDEQRGVALSINLTGSDYKDANMQLRYNKRALQEKKTVLLGTKIVHRNLQSKLNEKSLVSPQSLLETRTQSQENNEIYKEIRGIDKETMALMEQYMSMESGGVSLDYDQDHADFEAFDKKSQAVDEKLVEDAYQILKDLRI